MLDYELIWCFKTGHGEERKGFTYEKNSRKNFHTGNDSFNAALLNSRIGNGLGDYVSMGDNEIPDEYMEGILVESPTTLNDTWGFKYYDDNWKCADEVIRIKKHLNERGVNYLLNVGPDHLGRIPVPALNILREVGRREN